MSEPIDQPPASAFPFVGARAQVGPNPTYGRVLHCRTIKAGSTVTVLSEPDEQGDVRAQREDGEWSWVAARHLSPVPLSPGPDQPTEAEQPWRQVGALVWTGRDGVVMAERPEDAARAVAAVNAEAGLRAEVQRLRDEVERGAALLRTSTHLVRVTEDERDAARAELDAATTDGLGLPQVEVRREGVLAVAYIDGEKVATDLAWPHLHLQRHTAAIHLALLRAHLADEATADDKETGR